MKGGAICDAGTGQVGKSKKRGKVPRKAQEKTRGSRAESQLPAPPHAAERVEGTLTALGEPGGALSAAPDLDRTGLAPALHMGAADEAVGPAAQLSRPAARVMTGPAESYQPAHVLESEPAGPAGGRTTPATHDAGGAPGPAGRTPFAGRGENGGTIDPVRKDTKKTHGRTRKKLQHENNLLVKNMAEMTLRRSARKK